MVVYNSTNWITSQRTDVGFWYYDWERDIPFVAWMVIPYMLIDIFFVAAPFVCSTINEQRLFSRRITFTIFAAGLCFLLFPLELAVKRPHVEGWLGVIFNSFREVDLPYNLCPSLHIALRTILADFYARHTRGLTRLALHAWFSLIGVSTLLTYQHHVIDVIGGFILATVCFYLVRATPLALPMKRNRRIGFYYTIATTAVIVMAVSLKPWGLLLLWPATATGLVASGYFFLGPGVFGKINGRLPLSTRLILAPVLLGQSLSLLYYSRQCRRWDRVTDRVWIGRSLTNDGATHSIKEGVTAVVDLTVNFSEAKPFLEIEYLPLPVLDLTAPTLAQIDQAIAFIEAESRRGVVYVHCKIGYSRSAAIVGAYLVASRIATDADDAISRLRQVRPSIVIRLEAEEAIREYASRSCDQPRTNGTSDRDCSINSSGS
jgi:protein-tyrosine phosphatase/membrane-associated phospholipid phosphatase